jgi:hypothetical protein
MLKWTFWFQSLQALPDALANAQVLELASVVRPNPLVNAETRELLFETLSGCLEDMGDLKWASPNAHLARSDGSCDKLFSEFLST